MGDGSREQTLAVVTALLGALRAQDIERVAAFYAEDAVSVSPMFGEVLGRAAIVSIWRRLFTSFGSARVDISDRMVDGDRVAVFGRMTTVDRVGMRGRVPTGSALDYRLILMFTVVGGLIVREERIYDTIGVAAQLERARLDKELQTARDVQRALVPRTAGGTGFCAWVGDSIPSRAIGGDFFEFIELRSGAVGIVIGDVSGKGPAAALLAALIQGMLAIEAASGDGPAAILSRINAHILDRGLDGRFATLVYGVLAADGRLVYCNAGHNAPALVSKGGVRRLTTGGIVIGAFPGAAFQDGVEQLSAGDVLVMFSDGVTEARGGSGEEFGEPRLAASLRAHVGQGMQPLIDGVFADLNAFRGDAEPNDDITLALVRFG